MLSYVIKVCLCFLFYMCVSGSLIRKIWLVDDVIEASFPIPLTNRKLTYLLMLHLLLNNVCFAKRGVEFTTSGIISNKEKS
jgi:hypothetical protein